MDTASKPKPAVQIEDPAAATTHSAPVRTVLDRLAWEIELAAARCTVIDNVVGQVIERTSESERNALIETLHTVDLLNQHLHGLAAFSRSLSQKISPRARVSVTEALDTVTLGALVERLGVSMGAIDLMTDVAPAGQVDLF